MSLAYDLNRRPSIERGQPKTDFRPPRTEPEEEFSEFEEIPIRANVNLAKLEKALSRSPLDEIALLVQALTYGEMMELAEEMWKVKGEDEVTQDALPGMLHRWATGQRE
jgi:hypothetical protein